jgi:hypothetical protein
MPASNLDAAGFRAKDDLFQVCLCLCRIEPRSLVGAKLDHGGIGNSPRRSSPPAVVSPETPALMISTLCPRALGAPRLAEREGIGSLELEAGPGLSPSTTCALASSRLPQPRQPCREQ